MVKIFLQLSDNSSYNKVTMSPAINILRGSRPVASVPVMWILESRGWLALTMHLMNVFLSWLPVISVLKLSKFWIGLLEHNTSAVGRLCVFRCC